MMVDTLRSKFILLFLLVFLPTVANGSILNRIFGRNRNKGGTVKSPAPSPPTMETDGYIPEVKPSTSSPPSWGTLQRERSQSSSTNDVNPTSTPTQAARPTPSPAKIEHDERTPPPPLPIDSTQRKRTLSLQSPTSTRRESLPLETPPRESTPARPDLPASATSGTTHKPPYEGETTLQSESSPTPTLSLSSHQKPPPPLTLTQDTSPSRAAPLPPTPLSSTDDTDTRQTQRNATSSVSPPVLTQLEEIKPARSPLSPSQTSGTGDALTEILNPSSSITKESSVSETILPPISTLAPTNQGRSMPVSLATVQGDPLSVVAKSGSEMQETQQDPDTPVESGHVSHSTSQLETVEPKESRPDLQMESTLALNGVPKRPPVLNQNSVRVMPSRNFKRAASDVEPKRLSVTSGRKFDSYQTIRPGHLEMLGNSDRKVKQLGKSPLPPESPTVLSPTLLSEDHRPSPVAAAIVSSHAESIDQHKEGGSSRSEPAPITITTIPLRSSTDKLAVTNSRGNETGSQVVTKNPQLDLEIAFSTPKPKRLTRPASAMDGGTYGTRGAHFASTKLSQGMRKIPGSDMAGGTLDKLDVTRHRIETPPRRLSRSIDTGKIPFKPKTDLADDLSVKPIDQVPLSVTAAERSDHEERQDSPGHQVGPKPTRISPTLSSGRLSVAKVISTPDVIRPNVVKSARSTNGARDVNSNASQDKLIRVDHLKRESGATSKNRSLPRDAQKLNGVDPVFERTVSLGTGSHGTDGSSRDTSDTEPPSPGEIGHTSVARPGHESGTDEETAAVGKRSDLEDHSIESHRPGVLGQLSHPRSGASHGASQGLLPTKTISSDTKRITEGDYRDSQAQSQVERVQVLPPSSITHKASRSAHSIATSRQPSHLSNIDGAKSSRSQLRSSQASDYLSTGALHQEEAGVETIPKSISHDDHLTNSSIRGKAERNLDGDLGVTSTIREFGVTFFLSASRSVSEEVRDDLPGKEERRKGDSPVTSRVPSLVDILIPKTPSPILLPIRTPHSRSRSPSMDANRRRSRTYSSSSRRFRRNTTRSNSPVGDRGIARGRDNSSHSQLNDSDSSVSSFSREQTSVMVERNGKGKQQRILRYDHTSQSTKSSQISKSHSDRGSSHNGRTNHYTFGSVSDESERRRRSRNDYDKPPKFRQDHPIDDHKDTLDRRVQNENSLGFGFEKLLQKDFSNGSPVLGSLPDSRGSRQLSSYDSSHGSHDSSSSIHDDSVPESEHKRTVIIRRKTSARNGSPLEQMATKVLDPIRQPVRSFKRNKDTYTPLRRSRTIIPY